MLVFTLSGRRVVYNNHHKIAVPIPKTLHNAAKPQRGLYAPSQTAQKFRDANWLPKICVASNAFRGILKHKHNTCPTATGCPKHAFADTNV